MEVSIPSLVNFIVNQSPIRKTAVFLWDSCVISDYMYEVHGVKTPRTSRSLELGPYLNELRRDVDHSKIVSILSREDIPECYGDLMAFVVAEFPKAAELLQTKALA